MMKNMRNKTLWLFALMVACFLCVLPTGANAVTVTTVVDSADVEGSLRWALNNVEDGGVISFDVTGVISLDSQLEISKGVIIQGPGPDQLTISGQDSCRIFNIQGDPTSVDISGLSFEKGKADYGGAIYFDADNLTIDSCNFSNNSNKSINNGDGGAIHHKSGNLTISNSLFQNNDALGGGAVNSRSNISIDNCEFVSNTATAFDGGAVNISRGKLTMNNSTFIGNSAIKGSGGAIGIYSGQKQNIKNCVFSDNATRFKPIMGDAGDGGAIFAVNSNPLNIDNCIFSGNVAARNGGAITSFNPNTTLTNSTINRNSAERGGGISFRSRTIFNILNCTIVNNDASVDGGGVAITGNKFGDDNNELNISNCTISGNKSDNGSGICNSGDSTNSVVIKNTIIAANTNLAEEINEQIVDNGGDIVTIDLSIVTSDDIFSDVFSADLAINDGPYVGSTVSGDPVSLLTLALKPGSPAIDTAASTDIDGNVVSEDQRGVSRPQGYGYDKGAFEFGVNSYNITSTCSAGGAVSPKSRTVFEESSAEFEITLYEGYVLSDLLLDGESVSSDVGENGRYALESVTASHELEATFMIDPEMLEDAGALSFEIKGENKGPQQLDTSPVSADSVRSVALNPVSSSDIGGDLADTDFVTGLSFEIGFVSSDTGTAVTQLDLVMEVSRDLLGQDTCDAIDSGADLETAFFENVSIYKVVSSDAYDLFEVASADYEATDFFEISGDDNGYYVSMIMVIADAAAPDGEETVQALEEAQDSFFFVYDGVKDGKFTDPIVALRKSSGSDPVDPVNPDDNGGGTCSVGAFTPLAALLLLPLLLMLKK